GDVRRDEGVDGHALDGRQGGVAGFVGGGDVGEGDLVGTLLVVAAGDLHRIAGVTAVLELHALAHPAVFHVQAGNDAFGQAHVSLRWNLLVGVAQGLGLGDIQGTFVDGAAGDGADDAG